MDITRLEPRAKDVGGVPIARALPNKRIKTIGAWCFLDHAGPSTFNEGDEGMQVGRHPHTNLQTFTWMIEGEILHKDSLGNEQIITANKVNLMTAGTGLTRGISHTEQSVFSSKSGANEDDRRINMVQLWIALPTDKEIEPAFDHYPELPSWQEGSTEFVLTTGRYTSVSGETYKAPTKQYSKLIGLDVNFVEDNEVTLTTESGSEYGMLVVKGEIVFGGKLYKQNEMVYFDNSDVEKTNSITIKADKGTRIMFIGGEPLNNKVLLWWNFVADSKAEIEQSIIDWNNHHPRFGDVDSDLHRLPAPPLPEGFKE